MPDDTEGRIALTAVGGGSGNPLAVLLALCDEASGNAGGWATTEQGLYVKRLQFTVGNTGGGNTTVGILDNSMDWRERLLIVFAEAYSAADRLPGGGNEDRSAPDLGPDWAMLFTSAGSTQAGATPPTAPRRTLTNIAADLHVSVDSTNHFLQVYNTNAATDYHVVMHVLATGQIF